VNITTKRLFPAVILFFLISCAAPGGNENTTILIKTTLGDIKVKLYDNTPLHRDNFIKLVKSGVYDGVTFHRVIRDFMIQSGDPQTKENKTGLPDSLITYTLPAEFNSQNFHKRGALAAAREGDDVNPDRRSSGTQFYIVQGIKYDDQSLSDAELRINSSMKQALFNRLLRETVDSVNVSGKPLSSGEIQEIASMKMFKYLSVHKDFKVPEDQRAVYKSIGGVPRLDGSYTVFGEVIEGLDVVDRIAAVETDANDKPVSDVRILKMKIVK
jgi:cyclophilin family peptidyl-prolyl cis-trans isomerase